MMIRRHTGKPTYRGCSLPVGGHPEHCCVGRSKTHKMTLRTLERMLEDTREDTQEDAPGHSRGHSRLLEDA